MLRDRNFINDELKSKLTRYNTLAPRFYTLPKIHKPELMMRPIVSSIDCPNQGIATYLTQILTLAYDTNNAFYVNDSFSFSKFINNKQLPDNYVIVSFDVVSLFTNLPLEAILESLESKWEIISPHCQFDFDIFKKLLEFVFDSNIMLFKINILNKFLVHQWVVESAPF